MSGAQGQSTLGGWSFHIRITRQSPGIDLMAQSHSHPLRKSRIIQHLRAMELNFTFLLVFRLKVHLEAKQLDLWIFSLGEPIDFKPVRKYVHIVATSVHPRFLSCPTFRPNSFPTVFLDVRVFLRLHTRLRLSALSAVIPFWCPRMVHHDHTRLISRA